MNDSLKIIPDTLYLNLKSASELSIIELAKDFSLIALAIATILINYFLGNKNIIATSTSKFKQAWINDTRETLSRFVSLTGNFFMDVQLLVKKIQEIHKLNFNKVKCKEDETKARNTRFTAYEHFFQKNTELETVYHKLRLLINSDKDGFDHLKFLLEELFKTTMITIDFPNIKKEPTYLLKELETSSAMAQKIIEDVIIYSRIILLREWFEVKQDTSEKRKKDSELAGLKENFDREKWNVKTDDKIIEC
ncbi:MAG: hypothetical protein JSS63_02300 [Bacteroidetes bacterium]|nr:hypothetical protein [Bacteroidota bacterium]